MPTIQFTNGEAKATGVLITTHEENLKFQLENQLTRSVMIKNKLSFALLLCTLSTVVWADDDCVSPPNASGCLHEGMASAYKEIGDTSKWGFVNAQGQTVIPFKYDNVGDYKDGIVSATLKGKSGFIDKTGKTVIPFKFEVVGNPSEDLIAFGQGGKQGFMDKQGKVVIPARYQIDEVGAEGGEDGWPSVDANYFSEGLAAVKTGNKWGFIDKSGKQVIGFKYHGVGAFSEGLAEVMTTNQKIGFIDKTGKLIIPVIYESVWKENTFYKPATFKNGKVKLQKANGDEFCINKQNRTVQCDD